MKLMLLHWRATELIESEGGREKMREKAGVGARGLKIDAREV